MRVRLRMRRYRAREEPSGQAVQIPGDLEAVARTGVQLRLGVGAVASSRMSALQASGAASEFECPHVFCIFLTHVRVHVDD